MYNCVKKSHCTYKFCMKCRKCIECNEYKCECKHECIKKSYHNQIMLQSLHKLYSIASGLLIYLIKNFAFLIKSDQEKI